MDAMETTAIAVLLFVFAFGLVSRKLDALGLSPPLVFVGFGLLFSEHAFGLGPMAHTLVDPLAELTLMLVLFGDASRIDLRALKREAGLPIRMLALGMPLTILAGTGLALLCFPSLSLWEAGLLAAILAPTDAALGQAVVSSRVVPPAIRQALNVESGLNDGIALPVVMVFAALAHETGGGSGTEGGSWLLFWLAQVGLGPVAGIVVALVGGRAASFVCARGWMGETFERIAGLCLAILSYLVAQAIGGNGFIAAFVAGMVLGNSASDFAKSVHGFLETEGQLLLIAVFALVGALWAFDTVAEANAIAWVYALGSLTLVRIVPVALSMVGRELRWPTALFLGWFGPRGLASVLFALLVVEREGIPHAELIFDVAMLTVLVSVVVHGLSAQPGARTYGHWAESLAGHEAEMQDVLEHPTRIDPSRALASRD